MLYTRSELSRHYTKGDVKGPMADAGFKGHPSCHFCKKYFYSDQELYSHMQTKHMTCFICRRANPNDYTYYRNLKELEAHFGSNHHLCTHKACANKHPEERVFANKEEFHVHYVQEHGEMLSKQQKKQALQIDISFPSLRQDRQVYQEPEAQGQHEGSSRRPFVNDIEPEEDVFAHLGPSQWRSAVGSGRSSGYSGTSSTFRPSLNIEDYPSLPGTSKSAKKRAKAKAKAANEAQPARVLNTSVSAWGSASRPKSRAGINTTTRSEEITEKNKILMQKLRKELDGVVFSAFRQESFQFLEGQNSPQEYYNRLKALGLTEYAGELADCCPKEDIKKALLKIIDEEKGKAKPCIDKRDDSEKFVNLATLLRNSRVGEERNSNEPASSSSSSAAAAAERVERRSEQEASAPRISSSSQAQTAISESSRPKPKQHSEQTKMNNKLLMAKLKQELDPDTFTGFRMKSIEYLKGNTSAQEYYDLIVCLGLVELISDLANLCPDHTKRQALMDLHKHFLQAQMASDANSTMSGSSSQSMPKKKESGGQRKKLSKFERRRLGENFSYDTVEAEPYQRQNVHRVNPHNSWTQRDGRGLF